MPATHEPRDSDFVAYIDELQRESAARIQAQSKAPMIALHGAPVLDAQEAQELLARLARTRPVPRFISGILGAAVGAVPLLYAVLGPGGALPFLIGFGLLVWAVPRLGRASSEVPAADRQLVHRLAVTFGPRPPHK